MTPLDFITDTADSDAILCSSVDNYAETNKVKFDHDGFAVLKATDRGQRKIPVIAESCGPLFTIRLAGPQSARRMLIQPTTCGRTFINLIFERIADIPAKYPAHSFPPEVTLFATAIQRFALNALTKEDLVGPNVPHICEQLNRSVEHLRLAATDLSTLRRKHTKASLKNQKGGFRWLDRILDKNGRLCTLRIDLHFDKQYEWGSEDLNAISLGEAFALRAEFIRQLHHTFKRGFLGYMIKTEFTLRRSVHHHVLLILDGNRHWQHVNLAKQAGELWANNVTSGRGTYHNVNMHTDLSSVHCGIAEVHANDVQKINALKTKVIAYLSKPDHLARLVIPRRHRLFLKSIPALITGPKRGRPRKSLPAAVDVTNAEQHESTALPSHTLPEPENFQ